MNAIKQKIEENRKAQQDLEREISQLAKTVMPEYMAIFYTIGSWDCDKSPVGLCVYHHMEDKLLDDCLYCHEPDERK